MDFLRLVSGGGGAVLALIAVGVAGHFWAPWWVALPVLGAGGLAAKEMSRLPESPERTVGRPLLAGLTAWLAIAWALGPWDGMAMAGLAVLVGLGAWAWIAYGRLLDQLEEPAAAEPVPPPPPAPEPTPDERLDAVLREAPLAGLEFGTIVEAMSPYMRRSTVAAKLRQRGLKIGHGRWRAMPGPAGEEESQE